MPATQQKMMTDLFQQAVETFEAAVQTGVKVQEEATRWWTDALSEAGSLQEWQKKAQTIVSEAIPTAQKNAEEYMKLIDQNYHNSLDLLKRAFETGQSDSLAQAQAKTQELWEATLTTLRTNAQAIVQANARALESWTSFARRGVDGH